MSDVDTGAGRFPSGNDVWVRKAQSNGSTSRPWVVFADDQTMYLFIWYNKTSVGPADTSIPFIMGDYLSIIPGDAYYAMVGGVVSYSEYRGYIFYVNSFTSINSNVYGARLSNGYPGDIKISCLATTPLTGYPGYYGLTYPWHGQILVQRIAVNDASTYTLRGYMPGVFAPLHQYPLDNLSTDDNGRVAIHFNCYAAHSQVLIDAANFRDLP
jgi:hypothetical protein